MKINIECARERSQINATWRDRQDPIFFCRPLEEIKQLANVLFAKLHHELIHLSIAYRL